MPFVKTKDSVLSSFQGEKVADLSVKEFDPTLIPNPLVAGNPCSPKSITNKEGQIRVVLDSSDLLPPLRCRSTLSTPARSSRSRGRSQVSRKISQSRPLRVHPLFQDSRKPLISSLTSSQT